MPILPVRLLGDPILTKRAVAIDKVTSAEKKLIRDMIETMEEADGIGLAAPQVGVSKRIFVFRQGEEIRVLINPRIVRRIGEKTVASEGCLSIPGVQAKVARHKRVLIEGRDENGKPVSYECTDSEDEGRAATCVQHELDHLDGVLYIDRMEPETLVWLIEETDEETGEDIVALHKTTLDAIRHAYKSKRLPANLHLPDILHERLLQ